jgi:ribosomal protein S7
MRREEQYIRISQMLSCKVMKNGEKSKAEKIVKGAIKKIQERGKDPQKVLLAAVGESGPAQSIRGVRRGSQRVRVPFPLSAEKRWKMGVRLIVEEARKGQGIEEGLVKELIEASERRGGAVERCRRINKEGEAGNVYMRWK